MGKTKNLEKAVDILTGSYEKLWADVNAGKLSLTDIVKKHKDGFIETVDKAYALSKLPEVDIVIEVDETGDVVNVFTATIPQTVAVRFTNLGFDPHNTFVSTPIADYKEYVKEIEEEAETEES